MISLLESLSCDFESVKSGFLRNYLANNLKTTINSRLANMLNLGSKLIIGTTNSIMGNLVKPKDTIDKDDIQVDIKNNNNNNS